MKRVKINRQCECAYEQDNATVCDVRVCFQSHGCIGRCLEAPAVGLKPVNLLKMEGKAAGSIKLASL